MFEIKHLLVLALLILGITFIVIVIINRIRINKMVKSIGKDTFIQFSLEISRKLTSEKVKGSNLIVLLVVLWGISIGVIGTGLYADFIYQDNEFLGNISIICLIILLVAWGLLEKYFMILFKAYNEYFIENKDSKFSEISTELFERLKQNSLIMRFICLALLSLLICVIILCF